MPVPQITTSQVVSDRNSISACSHWTGRDNGYSIRDKAFNERSRLRDDEGICVIYCGTMYGVQKSAPLLAAPRLQYSTIEICIFADCVLPLYSAF